MTTGLIGIPEAVAVRARIAVVARSDAPEFAELLQRVGHEHEEFADWDAFRAACESGEAFDLVLYGEQVARSVPADIDVPGFMVGDGHDDVGVGALAETLAPLVGLATQVRAERQHRLELERLVEGLATGEALVGRCPVTRRLQGAIRRAAASDATVLIEGPAGSGKSLVARMIHCGSRRADQRLRAVHCSAVDAQVMADLLTDTVDTTLVLEGIDQLPGAAQSVLVKHLKERSGPRVARAPRIVATTSAHLPELIAKGVVREDLYYRLNAYPMVVPALRERLEDVRDLAENVLQLASAQTGRPTQGFTPAALVLLESMAWPGNVTQLEAVVRRAHVMAGGAPVDREHVASANPDPGEAGARPQARGEERDLEGEVSEDDIRPFDEEEQHLLSRALRATKGNVRRAAQLLGIGRATLYRKIQQYKLRMQ